MLQNQINGLSKRPILSTLLFLMCFGALQAEVDYIIPLNAKEHQIGNMLQWSTSQELNSHNFIIEKSIDGVQYDNIGLLEAAGMSGEKKSYRFLDVGVNDPKAFYRLKQVDIDGLYNYSQTVILNREISNQFMVVAMSKTSFDKTFQITMDVMADVSLNITISDLKGNVVQELKEDVTYGLNDLSIDLSEEKEGFYKIAVILKDEEEVLVVQKTDVEGEKRENVASKRKQNGG